MCVIVEYSHCLSLHEHIGLVAMGVADVVLGHCNIDGCKVFFGADNFGALTERFGWLVMR